MNDAPDIKTELLDYCHKIINNEIVACKKYQWACLRFINDIDKSDNSDWQWQFNNEKASRYINDWVSFFVHSTGLLAGKPKVFTPYERFVYGNIYGWEHKETGIRRFRKSYEQVARKNAKSQDKAIQALFELSASGKPLLEVYIAATKKEQTRHVWGEACRLFQGHKELSKKFICKYDKELLQVIIKHINSGSIFCRLSKDDKKTGDGTNPQFFIIDEYHLHDTEEYYNLAVTGMKIREDPLLSIITTAGMDLNVPCYRSEYDYISKILDPNNPVENDRYFIAICELDRNDTSEIITINGRDIEPGQPIDDINSLEAIQKTNPILSTNDQAIQLIREEVREAIDKPEKMRNLLTKTFNFWINQRESGFMDLAKWSLCAEIDDSIYQTIINNPNLMPYCGIDLSSTIDLTNVSLVFNLENDYHYIISHAFMPKDTVDTAINRDNVPYQLWINQGWITATSGNEVDYHIILEWILNIYNVNNWQKGEVCYDRQFATWLKQELEKKDFIPVDIPQNYTYLSLPTKVLRAKTYNKKIIHQNDPVLNWTMGNAIIRCGPSENIMLDKGRAKHRIDPVASLINAMSRAITNDKVKKKKGRFFMI